MIGIDAADASPVYRHVQILHASPSSTLIERIYTSVTEPLLPPMDRRSTATRAAPSILRAATRLHTVRGRADALGRNGVFVCSAITFHGLCNRVSCSNVGEILYGPSADRDLSTQLNARKRLIIGRTFSPDPSRWRARASVMSRPTSESKTYLLLPRNLRLQLRPSVYQYQIVYQTPIRHAAMTARGSLAFEAR